MTLNRARLHTYAVIPATVAALLLTMLAAFTTAPARAHGTSAAGAPAAAPEAAGSASGFTFTMFPSGQVGNTTAGCTGLGRDRLADPYISRRDCGFSVFDVTGVTGPLSAEIIGEGQTTPMATPAVTLRTTDNRYQITLRPTDAWTPGKATAVIKDGTGPIGQFTFFYNGLTADIATGGPTAPGDPVTVTGTIEEHVGGTAPLDGPDSDKAVPATYEVSVVLPDGTEVHRSTQQTAGSDGAIEYVVPGEVTAGLVAGAETGYRIVLGISIVDAAYTDTAPAPVPATGPWGASTAGTTGHAVATPADALTLTNSFVSSVGWVKPGEAYPSRIILTNPTDAAITPTRVRITSPTGSTITKAGSETVDAATYDWTPGPIAAGETKVLVLQSEAATTDQLETIVWRDLSSTAILEVPGQDDATSVSHGPKVIPPSEIYDTARYGDRPYPVVPVQYTDRAYQSTHSGDSLEGVLNDPANPGSTFNLFQEMSLGQLFPDGTVPSAGIASADFDYAPGFDFTQRAIPGNTCVGATYGDLPGQVVGSPLYPERITDGVYNLPGDTGYYGSDSNGSAVVGAVAGVGALQNIDSGCGDIGKLVYDSAVISDPEIDFSDYDTDKDGVVDFFMVVFAGCGGNGSSQGSAALCEYPDAPYDNVWPHSSSLENGYRDPVTGLPGYTTDDQLEDLEGKPLWYTDDSYTTTTTTPGPDDLKVFVRVGPYNVNPETAIDFASVISHEYGHSLGLPDFYSTGSRETYGSWNLMASDHSQNIDAYGRQELGWVVPRVLDGSQTVSGWTDSKQDIGTIDWVTPDGTPYTLTDGVDGTVHNAEMYVAKLPGRRLLDASAFETGDKASPSHLWWSGSGNDFGCAPTGARNFDLVVPGTGALPAGSTIELRFKSMWDIEWDYDYGYVLTTSDGGETYTSHESQEGYTTSNTDPLAGNPNQVGCQSTYDNGLTGSSGSYQDGTEATDRKLGEHPPAVFLADSYDVSDLAGKPNAAIRFSYATDPGLARPGWFIDDVEVVATTPSGEQVLLETDFETSGTPEDVNVFNGGCRKGLSTAQQCTIGWKYLQAGADSVQDHAYYLEMRDRSGFDLDGKGEADRGAPTFQPGLSLVYTDEAHGYGNAGTDSPPAQSPLDSVPQPGNETPNLDDAAFTTAAGRSAYSDSGAGHVDNYEDPSSESGNWEFAYDCLSFTVDAMSGESPGPAASDGDLTGDVSFTLGSGCGEFGYGYAPASGEIDNTAPTADAVATPSTVEVGDRVTLSGSQSTDAETPNDLDYSWDLDNGGTTKDATTRLAKVRYAKAGTYTPTLTVTDPEGLSATATATVVVKDTRPVARMGIKPRKPFVSTKMKLSAGGSSGTGELSYAWNFGDGGSTTDATRATVRTKFKKPGWRRITLTVTDDRGRSSSTSKRILVRRAVSCNGKAVRKNGGWQVVKSLNAPKGDYCDNLGSRRGKGKDSLTYRFKGPQLDVYHGRDDQGGKAALFVDGKRVGTVKFRSGSSKLRFRHHTVVKGLGKGRHTMKLVMIRGTAYLDSFITIK